MTATSRLEVFAVTGIPELRPGDDLAGMLAAAFPSLADGDVVAVTSKAVSKVEGRLLPVSTDPDEREAARLAAVEAETEAVVAVRGRTRIVRTRNGLVLAAAGVDASNVRQDEIALLPLDPDASAAHLRSEFRRLLDVDVAVIVTDTAGRAWRAGLVDIAIGVAGMSAVRDLRGAIDQHGNELSVTEMADADSVAAVSELVKGKLAGVPAAVVRGLSYSDDGRASAPLLRPVAEDMFSLGARDVVPARRGVQEFAELPVDPDLIRRSVAAAVTAPAPHHTTPWRFIHVADPGRRGKLIDAMQAAWNADLRADGITGDFADEQAALRLHRGDVLKRAPELVVPCMVLDGAHTYPDERRSSAEHATFLVAAGAGVQNFLVQLSAEGLASFWVAATLFCPEVVRTELDLPDDWDPVGTIGIGHPLTPYRPEPATDPDDYLVTR